MQDPVAARLWLSQAKKDCLMQEDIDSFPTQGSFDLGRTRSKSTAKSECLLDCPAVADQPPLLNGELFVEGLVYRLEHVPTTDPVGVLDVHLPRECLVLERDEHLGHGAIGRWLFQLRVGELSAAAAVLEDCIIYRERHIEAEESLRSS